MKNLLIYINPDKKFSKEHEILTKIQIDNSLKLGWKLEDILLVTNFNYEYNGIKALVIGDENYCEFRPWSSKIYTIITLFELGTIGDDVYWFHDADAFQLEANIDPKLGNADIGMVDYSANMSELYVGAHRWNSGSIFFQKESEDIFKETKRHMLRRNLNEERALMRVELEGRQKDPKFMDRIKILNSTYNFLPTDKIELKNRFSTAKKPLKIIHFDPFNPLQNELGQGLVSANISNLLAKHNTSKFASRM